MFILNKQPEKPFTVLNLTDIQLGMAEWQPGDPVGTAAVKTIRTLVQNTAPDLITLTGDQSWAGSDSSYQKLFELLDGFGVFWAPVWGNHDNQDGAEFVNKLAESLKGYKHCLYEAGDPALGNGNYVIRIDENARPAAALILMDSHDRAPYTAPDGTASTAWAKLWPPQLSWLSRQAALLARAGCSDVSLLTHIPPYVYREAAEAAFPKDLDRKSVDPMQSHLPEYWNPGYEGSEGVAYEGICSYPEEDGVWSVLTGCGNIRRVIVGHDHVNDFMIRYKGIQLIYALKTGAGCYYHPSLNGGTVLTVDTAVTVHHVYTADIRPET